MNKKALLALSIAILIPVLSYLLVKNAGDDAIVMPRNYLPDDVVDTVIDGKKASDTIWHKVADIRLQNQLGDTVNLYDIQGKVIVADFFFTSCGLICPKITANMSRMQQSFIKGGDPMKKQDSSIVQFLSFSIDPLRDSVPVLRQYANRFNVDPDNWWLLTGAKESIYDFIFQQLKVDKYDTETPLDPDFVHTQKFVLIDKTFHVRGYYNGLDSADLARLSKDIGLLMLEKATNPEPLPFDPKQMAIFFVITFIAVFIIIRLLFRKQSYNS